MTDNGAERDQTPASQETANEITADSRRVRTVTWQDPMVSAQAGQHMSGREYLQAILDGAIPPPPIAELMGFWLVELGDGRAVFHCVPAEYHYNPIGVVHGGLAATLLDSAIGFAVVTQLPVGTTFTTLELKVNYLRTLTSQTGLITCEGVIIHSGSRVAVAEARVTDATGKLYALATSTCLIIRS